MTATEEDLLYDITGASAFRPCREDGRWSVPAEPSDVLTEVETILMVYAMIRTLKPQRVVETGCNIGVTTLALARAIAENGFGKLWACDIDEGTVAAARARCFGLPVIFHVDDGEDLVRRIRPDFAFLDSSFEGRAREIKALPDGCTAVVHDTSLDTALAAAVRAAGGLVFPGPRGFGVIRT